MAHLLGLVASEAALAVVSVVEEEASAEALETEADSEAATAVAIGEVMAVAEVALDINPMALALAAPLKALPLVLAGLAMVGMIVEIAVTADSTTDADRVAAIVNRSVVAATEIAIEKVDMADEKVDETTIENDPTMGMATTRDKNEGISSCKAHCTQRLPFAFSLRISPFNISCMGKASRSLTILASTKQRLHIRLYWPLSVRVRAYCPPEFMDHLRHARAFYHHDFLATLHLNTNAYMVNKLELTLKYPAQQQHEMVSIIQGKGFRQSMPFVFLVIPR